MNFGGLSGFAVWNQLTRTLTGFGTTAFVPLSVVNQTIAAASSVNFVAAAGKASVVSIVTKSDATGTVLIQLTDTTNTWTVVTVAAGTTSGQDFAANTATVLWQLFNNSATVAAHYGAAGYTLSQ
jgi:hypothetical protein